MLFDDIQLNQFKIFLFSDIRNDMTYKLWRCIFQVFLNNFLDDLENPILYLTLHMREVNTNIQIVKLNIKEAK